MENIKEYAPPKPGEPETWETITPTPNRWDFSTPEKVEIAFQQMKALQAQMIILLDAMDKEKGFTKYEVEYVIPLFHQYQYDANQLLEYDIKVMKQEMRDQKIRERRPKTTKQVSESIEVISKDLNNIMSASKWSQNFLKAKKKDNK